MGNRIGALAIALVVFGGLEYPKTYRDLKLPELPDATLTSTGRQTQSLRDGLAIRVSTKKPVADVRTYYRDAMTKLGWTEEASTGRGSLMPSPPVARVAYRKDKLTFSAMITATPSGTTVNLNVIER